MRYTMSARPVTQLREDVGEAWITGAAAGKILGLSGALYPGIAPAGLIRKKALSVAGYSGRRKTMFRERDIRRARRFIDECQLRDPLTALRIVVAELEGRV